MLDLCKTLLSYLSVIQPGDERTKATSHSQKMTRSFLHSLAMFTAQKHGLLLALRHWASDAVTWPGLGSTSYAIWYSKTAEGTVTCLLVKIIFQLHIWSLASTGKQRKATSTNVLIIFMGQISH